MNFRSVALFLSATTLACLPGCGKTDPDPEVSRSIPGVVLIADAESGNAGFLGDSQFDSAGVGLHGGWYTYDDLEDCPKRDMPDGSIWPPGHMTYVMSDYATGGIPAPPEGSPNKFGIRFWGGGYTLWGGGIGIGLNNTGMGPKTYPLNKTGATGIRFYAKATFKDGATPPLPLTVKFQDGLSEGEATPLQCCFLNKDNCAAGTQCDPTNVSTQGCFAAPNTKVQVTDAWQKFELTFDKFTRPTFGEYADGADHSGDPLKTDDVYQLQFEVNKDDGPEFDVWIDDVGFIVPSSMPAK
ncbi:MAG TPA: hypothetical protein VHM70_15845 [Polyangiaceae bacterium]|nr:hypothetical protein [Polyangiaceae bacterium]